MQLKNKINLLLTLTFLFLFALIPNTSAQERSFTHLISNSEDWRDVYSIVHYGNLIGVNSDFLVSTQHGNLLIPSLSKSSTIRIISSEDKRFVLQYEDILRNNGFTVDGETVIDSANLELIEDLPQIQNFIVVGNAYGYSGIAVTPYAVKTGSWVFFADRRNIAEIASILENRDVNNIIIYGHVDREVSDALESYNPEIINEGDRFKDNIKIVEKYLELQPATQVAFTNGEFIEESLMNGFDPILFTGKENVPDQIAEYLKQSDFTIGVLVGSDLVGAATNIRRSTGISVIVKFAQGARNPSGPIAAVEGLDLFYLTIPSIKLSIHSAKYNRATSQLEITYKSDSNVPTYFKSTITPIDDNGNGARIGDINSIFIAPKDFKTVIYPNLNLIGDSLAAQIYVLYGDAPSSLERILDQKIELSIVNALDKCEIDVTNLIYSKPKDSFVIKIENSKDVDCWVDVELPEVLIGGSEQTLGSEGSIIIKPGKKGKVLIPQEMNDEDLNDNSLVNLIAYYGEREDSLVKIFEGKFNLEIQTISLVAVALILVILIIIILIIVVWRKRKKDSNWGF